MLVFSLPSILPCVGVVPQSQPAFWLVAIILSSGFGTQLVKITVVGLLEVWSLSHLRVCMCLCVWHGECLLNVDSSVSPQTHWAQIWGKGIRLGFWVVTHPSLQVIFRHTPLCEWPGCKMAREHLGNCQHSGEIASTSVTLTASRPSEGGGEKVGAWWVSWGVFLSTNR